MSTQKTDSQEPISSSIITGDMFASDAIIEQEVTLGDGSKRKLYFKELKAIEWKQHMEAEGSKDEKVRNESAAKLISRCLVEPDGRRALTLQQAATLKPSVAGAIFLAILRINGLLAAVAPATVAADDESDTIDGEGGAGN